MSVSLEQFGLDQIPGDERLELIGLLWDSLQSPLPTPEWHLRELEARRAAAEANPGAAISWDEFKKDFLRQP
jgi:putative addiction module component (TIGR02574 family)